MFELLALEEAVYEETVATLIEGVDVCASVYSDILSEVDDLCNKSSQLQESVLFGRAK